MDTTKFRMIAASSALVDDFDPTHWLELTDDRGVRLLVSDDSRTLVVSLLTGPAAVDAEAEKLAAAVIRSALTTDSFAVPVYLAAKAFSAGELADADSTLTVTEPLPGTPLSTQAFKDSPHLVDSLAEAIALLHSADTGAVVDAGLVTQEPQEIREALLEDLDRGAQTGRIPRFLLERWEKTLETPSVWHFLPSIVHSSLGVDAVRFDGERVTALEDIHALRVGDPAVDLAAVAELLEPDDFIRFFDIYTEHTKNSDEHISTRIELLSEFAVLEYFLSTVDGGDVDGQDEAGLMLSELSELLESQWDDKASAADAPAARPLGASSGEPRMSAQPTPLREDMDHFRPTAPTDADDDAEVTDRIDVRRGSDAVDTERIPDEDRWS